MVAEERSAAFITGGVDACRKLKKADVLLQVHAQHG